jgi:hypothetical protein
MPLLIVEWRKFYRVGEPSEVPSTGTFLQKVLDLGDEDGTMGAT